MLTRLDSQSEASSHDKSAEPRRAEQYFETRKRTGRRKHVTESSQDEPRAFMELFPAELCSSRQNFRFLVAHV